MRVQRYDFFLFPQNLFCEILLFPQNLFCKILLFPHNLKLNVLCHRLEKTLFGERLVSGKLVFFESSKTDENSCVLITSFGA